MQSSRADNGRDDGTGTEEVRERIDRLHRESPLTDVHAHPSLKTFLFDYDVWRHVRSGPQFDPDASRSDFEVLERGGVGVVWCAHYVVEDPFVRDALRNLAIRAYAWWYFRVRRGIRIVERLTTGTPWQRLQRMMDDFERRVAEGPGRPGRKRARIARRPEDVPAIVADGEIAIVQTIEGAHSLADGDAGDPLANLEALAERGVAMLTLTHFYWNGYVAQADAIPHDTPFRGSFHTDDAAEPLSDEGRALLDKLVDLGMLVDLTHTTDGARDAIYEHLGGRTPLVASHAAIRDLRQKSYNLRPRDVDAIAGSGGAVGVILMPYWLAEDERRANLRGAEAVWNTIKWIHERTGDWDHIMIGTDFDGFTDPPDDIPDASFLWRLTNRMLRGMSAELGMTDRAMDAAARKVLGANARRLLERGWRRGADP